jgi:hypothetical protein
MDGGSVAVVQVKLLFYTHAWLQEPSMSATATARDKKPEGIVFVCDLYLRDRKLTSAFGSFRGIEIHLIK